MILKTIKPQKYKKNQSAEYIRVYTQNADKLMDYLYDLPVSERLEYDDEAVKELLDLRFKAQKDLEELNKKESPENYTYVSYQMIKHKAKAKKISTIVAVKERMSYLSHILSKIDTRLAQFQEVSTSEKFLVAELEQATRELKDRLEEGIKKLNHDYCHDKSEHKHQNITIQIQRAREYPMTNLLIGLKRTSPNTMICSNPTREDKHPSLTVYLDTNTAFDYAIGKFYDSISLYMAINNTNFIDTIKILAS